MKTYIEVIVVTGNRTQVKRRVMESQQKKRNKDQ